MDVALNNERNFTERDVQAGRSLIADQTSNPRLYTPGQETQLIRVYRLSFEADGLRIFPPDFESETVTGTEDSHIKTQRDVSVPRRFE